MRRTAPIGFEHDNFVVRWSQLLYQLAAVTSSSPSRKETDQEREGDRDNSSGHNDNVHDNDGAAIHLEKALEHFVRRKTSFGSYTDITTNRRKNLGELRENSDQQHHSGSSRDGRARSVTGYRQVFPRPVTISGEQIIEDDQECQHDAGDFCDDDGGSVSDAWQDERSSREKKKDTKQKTENIDDETINGRERYHDRDRDYDRDRYCCGEESEGKVARLVQSLMDQGGQNFVKETR